MLQSHQSVFFSQGLTHDFRQKLHISSLFFDSIILEIMFDDHLVRKQALLDYKILINKVATLDFIKVVILLFWLKK